MSSYSPKFNSFVISIFIKELNATHNIRVTHSTAISTVAIDLINKINLKYDWSEFWFWYPSEKIWLLPKSNVISQFKIQPYSKINFTRRFNVMNIQLPDLQIRQLLLDFSKSVFQTNQIICKKFGIRHHEELSLKWRIIKKNDSSTPVPNRRRVSQSVSQQNVYQSNLNIKSSNRVINTSTLNNRKRLTRPVYVRSNSRNDLLETLTPSPFSILRSPISFFSIFENLSQNEDDVEYFESFENSKLANSPKISFSEALKHQDITITKSYKDRVNYRSQWMLSELTLMEHPISDFNNVLLLLRFKYHNYYCFNEKFDEIRINQIFHQAYWSVISGETDCSADETYLLAGILYQINKSSTNETILETDSLNTDDLDKEIDDMLDRLHLDLLGKCENEEQGESIEISGQLELIKYPKSFLSRYKRYSTVLESDGINLRKTILNSNKIPIKGNEIRLHVKVNENKYFVLEIVLLNNNQDNNFDELDKTKETLEKVKIRFNNKQEFIKWATGLRLLSKSIDFTLLSNYKYEYHIVNNIVEMNSPNINFKINKEDENINLIDMIGPRYNKPFKGKEIIQKIVYLGKSFKHYTNIEAKIAYIKCWLTLNNSGIYYLLAHINQQEQEILIGIGYNRIIFADIDTGSITNFYEMNKIVSWKTNWELHFTLLKFSDTTLKIKFKNSTDCQIFHEYLGGYLFIIMRNSERFTDLNETTFRNLTARNIE